MKNDFSDSSQGDQWNLFPLTVYVISLSRFFFFVREGGWGWEGGGKKGGNGVCESSVTLYQPVV